MLAVSWFSSDLDFYICSISIMFILHCYILSQLACFLFFYMPIFKILSWNGWIKSYVFVYHSVSFAHAHAHLNWFSIIWFHAKRVKFSWYNFLKSYLSSLPDIMAHSSFCRDVCANICWTRWPTHEFSTINFTSKWKTLNITWWIQCYPSPRSCCYHWKFST